ncbi:MAG: fibronectin type III domain-containing protein [Myxococcaceae bacterium]|nr:fibronectin type III domain-containing protein [Myxococcaceae bacterium]
MNLALGYVALVAAGQFGFGTVTLRIGDLTEVSVNASQCSSSLTGTFTTALTAQGICSGLQLFVTDATSCPDAPVSGDLVLTEVSSTTLLANRQQMDTRAIPVASLPYFAKQTGDGGTGCGEPGVEVTHRFCGVVKMANDFTCTFAPQFLKATPVTITYDTKAPDAPSIDGIEGLDQSATLTVTAGGDTASVRLEVRAPGGDWVVGNTLTTTKTGIVPGLVNGTTYEFRAIALDAAGNESPPSETVTAVPRFSAGFWDACVKAGCPPQQGCTTTAAAPLLLGAVALAMLRKRTR